MKKLRALGITCGIGSMLIGARAAGFQVVGNVEWRKYYHAKDPEGRNTFLQNFPGAWMVEEIDRAPDLGLIDLVMGHPECGNFSRLNGPNASRMHDPTDIPLFTELIAKVHPRYFVMDDLPMSFIAYPLQKYVDLLPDYDLFPEWVSNYNYGNVQKHRRRMFMIGALKTEKFVFHPGEVVNPLTVKDIIGDLLKNEGRVPNHDRHELDSSSGRFINMPDYGDRPTWRQFAVHIKDYREGKSFDYTNADGGVKSRIGSMKIHWDGPSNVLHGGNPIMHPIKCLPLTVRERARIQGFPDDFIFYGTKLDAKGRWNHEKNLHIVKQTGKAMPIQFCTYVARQIAARIGRRKFVCSGERMLRPDPFIDQAKTWWCTNIKYADQPAACEACWMKTSCPMSLSPSKQLLKEMKEDESRIREGKKIREGAARSAVRPRSAEEARRKLRNEVVEPAKDTRFEASTKSW